MVSLETESRLKKMAWPFRRADSSCVAPPPGHCRRHFDRGFEAVRRDPAGAGQVVGGTVVHRGADDGESQGDVDSVDKVQELQGNQALIVVHADHRGEFAMSMPPEEGIRREGTLNR